MSVQNKDWVKEYINYMIVEDFESAFALKDANWPKSFFKYRKLDYNTTDNIQNGQIYLGKVSCLNDPFECSLQLDNNAEMRLYYKTEQFNEGFSNKFGFRLLTSEIDQIVKNQEPYVAYSQICLKKGIIMNVKPYELKERAEQQFANGMEQDNESLRISCFSERNDSLLMWAHYAEEHKGICIEYDLENSDEIRPFLSPVLYSETISKISTFDDLTPVRRVMALLTKCKDWEYEAEWRYTPIKREGKDIPEKVTVPIPKAVYLGTRFNQNPNDQKLKLLKVLKELNIPIYQMKKHLTDYKLIKADFNTINW